MAEALFVFLLFSYTKLRDIVKCFWAGRFLFGGYAGQLSIVDMNHLRTELVAAAVLR